MGEKGAIVDAFVDRIEELAALEEQFADHQAAMAVIYGRRRIGKTALITEFVRDKRALYFLATEESEEQNRAAFQKQVAAFTGDELLGQVSVDNWDVLFDRLTSDGERLVVALDEFQYLGKANPAFPSVFQRIWDTMLSKRNVMVILCGSLISLMESQVLSYNSPLYGRRTAQVRMKQIPFRFYRDFFTKEIGRRELVELYSVTGGVPKYIESFRGVDDVYRGIEKSVLNSSSYLYDEPNFLLSKEVSRGGNLFLHFEGGGGGQPQERGDRRGAEREADGAVEVPESARAARCAGARGARDGGEPREEQEGPLPHQGQLPALLVPLRLSPDGAVGDGAAGGGAEDD